MADFLRNFYTGQDIADAALSPARKAQLLAQVDAGGGGLVSDIAWLLDTPGAMVRGALSGTGALNALSQTSEERTDGRELLRQAGLAGSEDNWGNFFGGLATEVVLDPLSMLSGPVKALSPAGKLAAKSGLLQRAPELLSRKFIATGGAGMAPELAERAARSAGNLAGEVPSRTSVAGRPLIGRRAAQRYGTLQDLLDYADDPEMARKSLLDAVRGDEARLDALLPRRLGGDLGIGLPLGAPKLSVNLPGGGAYTDAMDSLMSTIRWSPAGRAVSAVFDNKVGQATDAQSQAIYSGADQARQRAQAEARREATYQAARLYQTSPETFTEEGNRALGRLIEQPAENAFQSADDVFASNHPAARQYVQWWKERADELADEFTEAGLRGARFSDPNVSGYLPRRADGLLQQAGYNDPSLGRVLSTLTSDQAQRTGELMVPGGRDVISFDLSRDPFIAGGKRLAKNDEEAAQYIAEKLFGKRFNPDDEGIRAFDQEYAYGTKYWSKTPDGRDVFSPRAGAAQEFEAGGVGDNWADTRDWQDLFTEPGSTPYSKEQLKQARGLAQIMHRLPDNVIKDVPLFGQHPTQTIARYMEGRAGAKATMTAIYDSLAASTNMDPANLADGGKHISMSEALQRVGGRNTADDVGEVGAREQMRSRLAQRIGADPDKVDLSNLSVSEDLVNKLTRAREGFEQPQVAADFNRALSQYFRALKSGLLSWPRRIVRDMLSGAYSNWLEGALDVRALPVVKQLWGAIAGGPFVTGKDIARISAFDPQAVAYLKTMPRYASKAADEVAAEFYADLSASGLLDAGRAMDREAIVSSGNVADLLPGVDPQTFLFGQNSAVRELASRNWNPFSTNYRTGFVNLDFFDADKNPISRAGTKAGNLSDAINRLTGYLSLLRQGVDPMEAARRMKRAHVDYASLTPVERYIRDNFVPFYAYARNVTQEVLRQIAEQPGGRYGQGLRAYARAQESGDEYVPENIRMQGGVAIDPEDPMLGWLTDPDRTTTTYYTGLSDLPGISQLNMFDPDSRQQTASNLLQMLNPLYRTGGELLTGVDAFYGAPINEVSRGYGPVSKLTRAVTGDDDAGYGLLSVGLDKATDLIPYASRPLRTATALFNPDTKLPLSTNAFVTSFNELGAGRLRDATAEDVRRDQIRRLQKLASPYTRDITIPTIPKGMEGRVPQNASDALELSREIQEEGRQLRRRRLEGRFQGY
jgi:hypothetical protein